MNQRKMIAVIVGLAAGFLVANAYAQAKPASGFDTLKTLVGTWEATSQGGEVFTSSIRLVSNGTALEETFQNSEANQMVTLYVPDGSKVAMTHYCSAGNQPRMETVALTGDAKTFEFNFTGITNLKAPEAGHMKHLVIEVADKDHFTERWTWHEKGDEKVEALHFTRKK